MAEVEEASDATCIDIALDQLHEAQTELRRAHPDLGHVQMHLQQVAIWLRGLAVRHG